MKWVHNDGGRAAAGFKGRAGDCVVRAIAIATDTPYRVVYNMINCLGKSEPVGRNKRPGSARRGVKITTIHAYLKYKGWKWIPTMFFGSGCKVHLREGEVPAKGRIIVRLSRHITAICDGVIHDTYNPSRGGTRCVYGYWIKTLRRTR